MDSLIRKNNGLALGRKRGYLVGSKIQDTWSRLAYDTPLTSEKSNVQIVPCPLGTIVPIHPHLIVLDVWKRVIAIQTYTFGVVPSSTA